MRLVASILLCPLWLTGCAGSAPRALPEASVIEAARAAADDRCAERHGARPFARPGPEHLAAAEEEFIWTALRSAGSRDIEAVVHITPAGQVRSVDIRYLISATEEPVDLEPEAEAEFLESLPRIHTIDRGKQK